MDSVFVVEDIIVYVMKMKPRFTFGLLIILSGYICYWIIKGLFDDEKKEGKN